jgi:hypothetical protein
MAAVVKIGDPINEAERTVLALLRDRGPASWTVFHNFEIASGGESFEVDVAVLTPHAVFLIDVKGTKAISTAGLFPAGAITGSIRSSPSRLRNGWIASSGQTGRERKSETS